MSQQAQAQPRAWVTPGQGSFPAIPRHGTMRVEKGGAAESRAEDQGLQQALWLSFWGGVMETGPVAQRLHTCPLLQV